MGGGSQVADQNARQDQNQFPALIAHSGTAGTAETVRIVATTAGAVSVDVVSGEIIASLGTVSLLEKGTITPQEAIPTADTKNNPSFVLTYDGSNQPTLIAMTIGGVTYNRTLTWTSGNLTAMTAWSAA